MKKLFLVILFYLFSQVSSLANERDTRLNQLFNELKANKSKIAIIIEQEIWDFFSLYINNSSEVLDYSNNKKLVSISNLFGQKINKSNNTFLLFLYDDGSVEKKLLLK